MPTKIKTYGAEYDLIIQKLGGTHRKITTSKKGFDAIGPESAYRHALLHAERILKDYISSPHDNVLAIMTFTDSKGKRIDQRELVREMYQGTAYEQVIDLWLNRFIPGGKTIIQRNSLSDLVRGLHSKRGF